MAPIYISHVAAQERASFKEKRKEHYSEGRAWKQQRGGKTGQLHEMHH